MDAASPSDVVDAASFTSSVRLRTPDGWTISGTYTHFDNGPLVLLLHPVHLDRGFFAPLIGALHERRPFNTLAIDVRGHGRSVVGPHGVTGWDAIGQEAEAWSSISLDVSSALSWARADAPDRRVYIVAWDFAARNALSLSLSDPDVVGLVLLAPALRRDAAMRSELEQFLDSGRPLMLLASEPPLFGMLGQVAIRADHDAEASRSRTSDLTSPLFVLVDGPIGAPANELLHSRPDLWLLVEDWLRFHRDGTPPRTQAPSPRSPPVPGDERRGPVLFHP